METAGEMQNQNFEPLFEDERPFSEAELSGTDEEMPEKKEVESSPKEDKPEESEGYAPHAALHETREMLKEEKAARKDLEDKVDKLAAEKAEPEPEMPDGFKVLTDLEFDELVDDDPQEALRYQVKLQKYEKQQAEAKKEMGARQAQIDQVINQTVERIEKAVPGLYDEDNSISKDLADFAINSGFKDENYLEVMTNPSTIIIPAGTNNPYLLGDGAASLIELLHNLHKGKETPQEEGAGKGKISTGPVNTKQFTEAEFTGLSEADQEKLLRG